MPFLLLRETFEIVCEWDFDYDDVPLVISCKSKMFVRMALLLFINKLIYHIRLMVGRLHVPGFERVLGIKKNAVPFHLNFFVPTCYQSTGSFDNTSSESC